MKYEPFDCCSAYNECSDLGRCIREAAKRNVCTYWVRHLSQGVAFYGKNPGLLEGHIFIMIGGRAFRISKRYKDNSYSMDRVHRNALAEELKFMGIPYSTAAEGECLVTGCPENPAKYKIDFAINEYEYTIKNYNGWALETDVVQQIIEELGGHIKLTPNPPLARRARNAHVENIEYNGYYGIETAVVFDPGEQQPRETIEKPPKQTTKEPEPQTEPNKQPQENMKLPTGDELKQGKFVQSSIWDVMLGKI
jgi:hypothetical protein